MHAEIYTVAMHVLPECMHACMYNMAKATIIL